jgi:hypothetical protein
MKDEHHSDNEVEDIVQMRAIVMVRMMLNIGSSNV